jgi:NADH-ubiquinone oxidoreductase chain 2
LLIITIGYSLYIYVLKDKEKKKDISDDNDINESDDVEKNYNVMEKNNSPIQLITQLKGYFLLNPIMAMSLCITIYSFVGIPPLIGFFAKQMVLSAALDNGYIFLSYIAILVSVISAVYYLNIIRQMFFENSNLKLDDNILASVNDKSLDNNISNKNILVNSSLTITISIITLIITLFFSSPNE